MEARYRKCVHFASLFNTQFRYDIVHDAWLYYYNKSGTDLFSMELSNESSYLYTVIKNAFYRWYYHERNGKIVYPDNFDPLSTSSFLDKLIREDTLSAYKEKFMSNQKVNPELASQVFDYLSQGYDQVSTAEKLGITKQRVQFYSKQLR